MRGNPEALSRVLFSHLPRLGPSPFTPTHITSTVG